MALSCPPPGSITQPQRQSFTEPSQGPTPPASPPSCSVTHRHTIPGGCKQGRVTFTAALDAFFWRGGVCSVYRLPLLKACSQSPPPNPGLEMAPGSRQHVPRHTRLPLTLVTAGHGRDRQVPQLKPSNKLSPSNAEAETASGAGSRVWKWDMNLKAVAGTLHSLD